MFLYFLPGRNAAVDNATLTQLGLGYVVGEGGPTCTTVHAGPGRLSGQLVVPPWPTEISARFDADKQTWRRRGDGAVWIGMLSGPRPGPSDLVRPQVYAGQHVRLADGNEWAIPRALALLDDRPLTLPAAIDLDEHDLPVGRVHPRYEALCEQAFAFFIGWSGRGQQISPSAMVELAAAALSINYRIGKIEAVALLGLFDSESLSRALRAIIDADAFEDHVRASEQTKKVGPVGSESAGASSAPGSTGAAA